MFNHNLLILALCLVLMANAVSLLSPSVLLSRTNYTWKEFSKENTMLSGMSGMPAINQNINQNIQNNFSSRFRFLNRLTMRRSNYGGNGRIKKQKSRPQKMNIGGIDVTVTNVLIAINVACFLLIKRVPSLANKFMKYDRMIARGQTYRLVTALFVHNQLYHVGANSYSLYNVGPMADKVFGPVRFLSVYLFSGICANVITYALGTSPASLGASGATFGIIGAFATHFYRNRKVFGKAQSDAALSSIAKNIAINLVYGFSSARVDNAAHIAGGLSGALFTYLFGPRLSFVNRNGRRIMVDKPLIPYTKYWKMLTTSGTAQLQGLAANNGVSDMSYEVIDYSDDAEEDSDFGSDSTGMRGVKYI